MTPPKKPFPGYKWRWAVFQPTENLNRPDIFLGVLRTLRQFEGQAPNSASLISALEVVERETRSPVTLARTRERNLIRNSGQYWKIFGLLQDRHGLIALTDFGRQVADGAITKAEFAATVIKTFELPNRNIESDTSEWDKAGVRIKPFELVLQILSGLHGEWGPDDAYLTTEELVQVVIPLAGAKSKLSEHIESLKLYRKGGLDLTGWPDCAPESNDKRMAREFLLFLLHYGYCNRIQDKYMLISLQPQEIVELKDFIRSPIPEREPLSKVVRKVRETFFPEVPDRKRVQQEIISRPQQAAFRANVLQAYNGKCLVTGTRLETVLIAAHIIPIAPPHKGNDLIGNGICLRADIHLLFDSGHLRIDVSGNVHLSQTAGLSVNYGGLPPIVKLPDFVRKENIEWRWKYY